MKFGIQTYSLTKSFKDIKAVNHLDIGIEKNTIFGLVGPDGAGKTTTIRMLCSLISPDSGTARIGDFDIIKESEKIKNCIGYMPQKFSLYGDLTVLENLKFYSEIYQIPPKISKTKIDELLAFSNLTQHADKLASQLSGGMKQKLALSCNLIHTPQYLFLDEPTIGVDPVARRELWKILFSLRNQGVTIFVSTPYMDEAERCDEIGLMYNGSIIEKDTPANIINNFQQHILCIYSDDNYSARDLVKTLEYVDDAYLFGEELHVVVEDYRFSEKLKQDFKEYEIEISSIHEIKPSLEDVFVHTIKNKSDDGDI